VFDFPDLSGWLDSSADIEKVYLLLEKP